ncbi:MAG: GGDEF domain-containing protein [Synergistaceae bacterium]|nr:GGDEF domain-containing protein [Synergistaceae bacterium]
MYSATIKTAGLDGDTLSVIEKSLRPLKDFACAIEPFDNLSELHKLKDKKAKKNLIIIFDEENLNINLNLISELREANAFKHAKFILCAKNILKFNKYLDYIDAIWTKPFTPELVNFYLAKLIERVKLEQDLTFYAKASEIQSHKKLLEMARQDYLTGLATRWYFQEYITRKSSEKYLTCIYFDLDHFKSVNDTYGHQTGDMALAATAEMLQHEFADGFIARFGGDEFVTILTGFRPVKEVEAQVNNFMAKLLAYYQEIPAMRNLSISAGISQTDPNQIKSIDQLMRESDKALYCAKNCGRARCCIYNSSMEDDSVPCVVCESRSNRPQHCSR